MDPAWFTGKTSLKVLPGPGGSDMYHVRFSRGARTKMHSHGGEQLLIATSGGGVLETYRRSGSRTRRASRISLGEGDIARIPAGVLHAHGSAGRSAFSHIAINVRRGGRAFRTDWLDVDGDGRITGRL